MIVAALVGMAVVVSHLPPDEDFVALQFKKDCRALRERVRANSAPSLPAEMEAACKRVGF